MTRPLLDEDLTRDFNWSQDDRALSLLGNSTRVTWPAGFHKPGDVENRLGYHVGQLGVQP